MAMKICVKCDWHYEGIQVMFLQHLCAVGCRRRTNPVTGVIEFRREDVMKMQVCEEKNKDGKCNDYRYKRPAKKKKKK